MVRHHEHTITGDGNAAIRVSADDAFRPRALVVPERPAGSGVERVTLIGRAHVHDPVNDDRRDLQLTGVGYRENPFRCQVTDVGFVDLRQRGVSIATRIAVVGWPAGFLRHLPEPFAGATQEVDALVIGAQLQVVEAFTQHLPVERRAVRGLHRHPHDRIRFAFDGAQELDQIGELGVVHRLRGHALRRDAVVHQLRQLTIVEGRQSQRDRRPHVAAVAIRAVTGGATAFERLLAGKRVLGQEIAAREQQEHCANQARTTTHAREYATL